MKNIFLTLVMLLAVQEHAGSIEKNKIVLYALCPAETGIMGDCVQTEPDGPILKLVWSDEESDADESAFWKISSIQDRNGGFLSTVKILVDGERVGSDGYIIHKVHREVLGSANDPLGSRAGSGKICAACASGPEEDIYTGSEDPRSCKYGRLVTPVCVARF